MRFRALIALALPAVICGFVGRAHAEEPVSTAGDGPARASVPPALPSSDVPPNGTRATTVIVGASITLASYGLALGSSYLWSDEPRMKHLRIPIAGPWMTLGQVGCPKSDPDCSKVPLVFEGILLVLGGVTQVGGLGVIGEGLFLNTSSSRPAAKKSAGVSVRAVPMDFGAGSAGLGFVGTF